MNVKCARDLLCEVHFEKCTPSTIRRIVMEQPDSLNFIDSNGCSPLCCALLYPRSPNLILELLRLGADVNFIGKKNIGLLHYAVFSYKKKSELVDVLKLLIKFGANVNLKDTYHRTPVHILLRNVEGSTLLRALEILLKNGVNADHVSGNFTSYLEYACSNVKNLNDRLEVSRMLLEYGVKPDIHKNMHRYNINFKREINLVSIEFTKLLMQYVLMDAIKTDTHKKENFLLTRYDKILDLNEFSGKKCFQELTEYKKCLIKEFIVMQCHRIDEKLTMFSFISERCCSGLHNGENEELLFRKVISEFHSNRYVCCDDLYLASIKHEDFLSVMCIYAEKSILNSSFKAKVTLNSDVVLELVSYLTRRDVSSLTLAFWNANERNDKFPLKRSYK